jgi:hypothetical protein
LGVTGGTIQCAVAPNSTTPALSVYRGTLACRQRVKRFRQGRAVVRSSAWGVNGGLVQRAVAPNSTAPALSVYRGTLACRQRVKRFCTAELRALISAQLRRILFATFQL